MYSKVKPHVLSPRPIKFVILYFHYVSGVCFVTRDEPYGVNPTLTVGSTIRLISILIYCVQHWPVIEPTLAQRLVFVLKWLHRPIPQPQTHEAFGPSFLFFTTRIDRMTLVSYSNVKNSVFKRFGTSFCDM